MATLILQPNEASSKDTEITNNDPTFNFGARNDFHVGRSNSGSATWRTLIQFDLSSVPANATILDAQLRLYCTAIDASVDTNIGAHRLLVSWEEGQENGTNDIGLPGASWNYRNKATSLSWSSPGGAAGTDYATTASSTILVDAWSTYYDWDVTDDVIGFKEGTFTNHGWMLIATVAAVGNRKYFASASMATTAWRPQLVLTYSLPGHGSGSSAGSSTVSGNLTFRIHRMQPQAINGSTTVSGTLTPWRHVLSPGAAAGSSSASATLSSQGYLQGSTTGIANLIAELVQPGEMSGLTEGSTLPAGSLFGIGYLHGLSAGSASGSARPIAEGNLAVGSSSGSSTVVGHIMSRQLVGGLTAGQATVVGSLMVYGRMSGSAAGSTTLYGNAFAVAVGKAFLQPCTNAPLLFITDGTIRPNGQLNRLNLLNRENGYILDDWTPTVAQYKNGGYFSDSALSSGRRLNMRVFENPIEIITLKLRAYTQDQIVLFLRELLNWQEAAADYWTGAWAEKPVYLGARSARETHIRYALIHVISIPQLANPYSQPFFGRGKAVIEELTLRIERDHWAANPPGEYECVPISSTRSWTVAGWQSTS